MVGKKPLYSPFQKECPFVFKNGTLKTGGEREPVPRPKKWPVSNIVATAAQNIPDCFVAGGDYEEEDGELTALEVHRAEAGEKGVAPNHRRLRAALAMEAGGSAWGSAYKAAFCRVRPWVHLALMGRGWGEKGLSLSPSQLNAPSA